MNFKETCADNVKKISNVWSKGDFWKAGAGRHESNELKDGLWRESTTGLVEKKQAKNGHRNTNTQKMCG